MNFKVEHHQSSLLGNRFILSRIRILSEHLSNQIAAGEVVERPASVVKELIENSIDAGASQVDVEIEGSGVRLMRVVDNGCGMIEDDVLLCLERHATSKIQEESQLGAIATLGFRGEALPSIGSVARMTIISRDQEKDIGTLVEVRYGALHAVHEQGCSRGTVMEVRNLFGNVPARKKFLKSARTETYHIEEVVKNQALAMPEIGFTLRFDDRTVLDCPSGSDLESRLRYIFRYDGPLLSLEHSGAAATDSVQVGGYLLLPESTPTRSARLRILVNGRAVQDRMIRNAVTEGLHGFLMKGYQPAGAVLLSISPELVDVNVHPAKREIRFRDHREVYQLLKTVVKNAIENHQEHARGQLFSPAQKSIGDDQDVTRENLITTAEPVSEPFQHPLASAVGRGGSGGVDKHHVSQDKQPQALLGEKIVTTEGAQKELEPVSSAPAYQQEPKTEKRETEFAGLRLIGQLFSLYLLCEKGDQFIVIDQHAAHERILYGQMKQGYLTRDIPQQGLLFPVTVELGPDHMETMERCHEDLQSLGLEIDYFGETTWVIKSVPAVVSILDPVSMLFDILDMLYERKGRPEQVVAGVIDDLLASMACKAAIKAGNVLKAEEMIGLLQQMEESDVFSHCPHGRPVIKTFLQPELEKWFHRHGG